MKRFVLALALAASVVVAEDKPAFELDAKPAKKFDRHEKEGAVTTVCWEAKGDYLASAGEKGWVYVWDIHTDEVKDRIVHGPPARGAYVPCIAAYPKAPIMVHCSEFGIKFNLIGGRGKVPHFDAKHKGTPTCIDFSADGDHMASSSDVGEVIVWDLWTGEPYRSFQSDNKKCINWLRYFPDGNRVAVAAADGKCRVYDTKENKQLIEFEVDSDKACAIDVSPDGKWIVTGGKDKKIKLWACEDGKAGAVLEGHEDMIETVAFHPKKEQTILASGADDKTVRVWDFSAKKELQKIGHDDKVLAVAWRPDGKALATGAGKLVQVFELKGEKKEEKDEKK